MSFCRYCGQELDDDARFCTGCGREIVGAGGQAEMPAGVSPAASAEPAVSSAAEPDAPQNFRAVVSKQRSRAVRRLPIPILIALALALTAGVAFASYMVYTQVVEPALHGEGVVAPNDAGVTASDAQSQTQIETQAQEQVHLAQVKSQYQAVLDDYKAALDDYAAEGTSYNQKAFTAKHPYLYADRINDSGVLNASKSSLVYTFAALGDEGNPALIVGTYSIGSSTEGDATSPHIVAIYKLVDGEPTRVLETGHEHVSLSLIDGNYVAYSGMFSSRSSGTVQGVVYLDLSGRTSESVESSNGSELGSSSVLCNGLSVCTNAPDEIHVIASYSSGLTSNSDLTLNHPDGSTTTIGKDASTDEMAEGIDALKQECSALYSGATDLAWSPISSGDNGN